MDSLSDAALNSLTWWLGWLGVVATTLGLLATAGSIIIRKEAADRAVAKQALNKIENDRKDKLLEEARQTAADAHHRAQQIEKEREQEKKLSTPRTITPQQRTSFIAAMANSKKGTAYVWTWSISDTETKQYAAQLRQLLISAGFETGLGVGTLGGDAHPVGVVMYVKNLNHPPVFANDMLKAFFMARMQMESGEGAAIPKIVDEEPNFIVGSKPAP